MNVCQNEALYKKNQKMLKETYREGKIVIENHLVDTLAQMLTGLMLGYHVQLWMIALFLPFDIQLTSQVRKFERFLSDERVNVKKYFMPFVKAMHTSLGNEVAYIIMDCTKSGPKCRTLVIAAFYQNTVLPLCWKTFTGKKGHIKGKKHKELLEGLPKSFLNHQRVVVLGDAEFGNNDVITWLREKKWGFVFRVQKRYKVHGEGEDWMSIEELHKGSDLKQGETKHWEGMTYTDKHKHTGLTITVDWGVEHKEPICLVSSLSAAQTPHLIYEMRFAIETLFGNHKSRGFQLDRTHLTNPAQIDRLFLILAIATCQVLGLGTHLIITEQSHLVDRTDRRDLSLFQMGFRWFMRLFALNRLNDFEMCFRWDFSLPEPGFQSSR